jgi:hypothetical protein
MEKARQYYMLLSQKNNVAWIESTYFKRTLKTHLKQDCEKIIQMILLCDKWNPQTDILAGLCGLKKLKKKSKKE